MWVLTETHDSISPGPGFGRAATAGADRPGDSGERWTAIWSRFPIEALPPTSDPIRAVAARVVPPDGAPLIVYGTVLPWLGSPWREFAAANGRAFAEALEVQARDWRALRESNPDHDIVVAGDFNQDLADTHYYGSRANRHSLLLALERAELVALTAGRNDPVRRDSSPCACIDHICISKRARWQPGARRRWPDVRKPDRGLSDHFGTTIELANTRQPQTLASIGP